MTALLEQDLSARQTVERKMHAVGGTARVREAVYGVAVDLLDTSSLVDLDLMRGARVQGVVSEPVQRAVEAAVEILCGQLATALADHDPVRLAELRRPSLAEQLGFE